MYNFEFFAPTEVCFGKGTVDRVGEYVKKYHGTKVMIHYGGGSVIRTCLKYMMELNFAGKKR